MGGIGYYIFSYMYIIQTTLGLLSISICLYFQIHCIRADYGILFSKKKTATDWQNHFCINYNSEFKEIPTSESNATTHNIVDISNKDGCKAEDYDHSVNHSVVIVARGNCLFVEKAYLAQAAGAKALIISSNELLTPGGNNNSDYNRVNITVATASKEDIKKYVDGKTDQVAIIYQPTLETRFDPNMVVIFLIAVSNVVIGGFWAGISKNARLKKNMYKHKRKQQAETDTNKDEADTDTEEEESVDVSMVVILVFVVMACIFLVLLYFFYDYLVYVIIALFCLASSVGLFYCLRPLVHKICPWNERLPPNKIPLFRGRPQYRDLGLLFFCFGVAIFWGIVRHAPYAWVIQNILGYAFCINVMKSLGLPNLKICTVMLCLLFIYDIFFVFITPLFTSGGDSIMVKVATGSGSKTQEKLPMLFQVPRLTQDVLSSCPLPYSLLGFGDVIIPGLLISHNHAFDLRVNSRRLYYIVTSVGYALGLIITFVALALMEKGQPALLYLVPCTLLPTYIIGCVRGEVRQLWSGPLAKKEENTPANDSGNSRSDNLESVVSEPSGAGNRTTAIPRTNSASSSENECKGLLKK